MHDLGGRLLLPGFIDTHAHLIMAAGATGNLDGATLTVDGDAGVVIVHEEAS